MIELSLDQLLAVAYDTAQLGGDLPGAVMTLHQGIRDGGLEKEAIFERDRLINLLRARPDCCHVSKVTLDVLAKALAG